MIQAYTDGVNAYLNHNKRKLPVEFTLLSHRPDLWKPEDTMAFSRVMLWQLSHAWQGEIIRAEIAEAVGADNAAELELQFPDGGPVTLPKGIEFNAIDPDGKFRIALGPFLDRGKGSNSWVVAPKGVRLAALYFATICTLLYPCHLYGIRSIEWWR